MFVQVSNESGLAASGRSAEDDRSGACRSKFIDDSLLEVMPLGVGQRHVGLLVVESTLFVRLVLHLCCGGIRRRREADGWCVLKDKRRGRERKPPIPFLNGVEELNSKGLVGVNGK